jgi:hypothetical protein
VEIGKLVQLLYKKRLDVGLGMYLRRGPSWAFTGAARILLGSSDAIGGIACLWFIYILFFLL